MNQIFLNKSKSKTIVFIHGFYATAGYWLPYLNFFKNYRIALLNINYDDLLKSDNMIISANSLLRNVNSGNNFHALISHSLGTVLSNFIDADSVNKRFEICPVGYSVRSNTSGFVKDIRARINLHEQMIISSLLLVDQFIYESKSYFQTSCTQYVPDADQYFTYTGFHDNHVRFKGDHFEILEAIRDIEGKLES